MHSTGRANRGCPWRRGRLAIALDERASIDRALGTLNETQRRPIRAHQSGNNESRLLDGPQGGGQEGVSGGWQGPLLAVR